MVLKANDRRTSCPCHDEFRGPRSDYVRQDKTRMSYCALTAGARYLYLEPGLWCQHVPKLKSGPEYGGNCLFWSKVYECIERFKQGRTSCDNERSASPSTTTTEDNVQVIEGIVMEVDNGAVMMNSLLPPPPPFYDYEGRRVTLCIEMLPTTPHSALDTSTVAKPWK
ncbi:hypothetical protein TNCV_4351951 [Trichonephila clavipes]|nr:hypothetical protein TNCV_4351951 [Trichonephila clavipes]